MTNGPSPSRRPVGPVTAWLLLGLGLVLVAVNAVFVASETALVTVDRTELGSMPETRQVRLIGQALRSLSTQLSGSQLGITVTSLAIGLLAEPSVGRLLLGPLTATGLPEGAVAPVSFALALALAATFQVVFGELVPKNIALARPLDTVRAVITVQLAFTMATKPVISVLNGSANAVLRLLNIEPTEALRSARTPDELALLVQHSAAQGSLQKDTAQLLVRSLTFGDKRASDVMTPRVQVEFLDADDKVSDVITRTRASGHSRFPVVDAGPDDIVGLVHIKDAVAVPLAQRNSTRVRDIMRPPVLVPSTLDLDATLDELQRTGLQIAVVVDEFDGTDGVVTFEDIVEELVGEVVDEHDTSSPDARRRTDGSWEVSGRLRPDEVYDLTGIHVATSPHYETMAGFVMRQLGRVAHLGDKAETDDAAFQVQQMDGRRIDKIVIVPRPTVDDELAP